MKFLADMGISLDTVMWLRNLGHDAVHLHEQGLDRLPDPEILIKARNEQRVLLTHDLDFGYLLAISGTQLPSVVIFRLADMRPRSVNYYLERVLQHHQDELTTGAIVIVTEGRTRVRMLPI
uniref:Hypothetical conserved protein n=2 Tax=Candidatus Bipolaricaulota TaxID=67810 RepID=H5SDH4_9BACT|nr:hypothetical conserved protein [uncultured Acetothermia bacterium]BAL58431.1 hypothetical conserved protein [Candidatus Acetothermum autotrophicum]